MSIQLKNGADYATEVVPDEVVVTATDKADGSTITVTFASSDISTSSEYNYQESEEFQIGHSYTVTSVAKSSSEYVTNSEASGESFDIDELTAEESQSDGYSEQTGGFPGGGGGGGSPTITLTSVSVADSKVVISAMGTAITCAMTELDTPNEGSSYSYTLSGSGGMGEKVTGVLELLIDYTAEMTIDGFGPFSDTNFSGTWAEEAGVITVSMS